MRQQSECASGCANAVLLREIAAGIKALLKSQAELNSFLTQIVAHNADLMDMLAQQEDDEEPEAVDLSGKRVSVR